MNTKLVLMPICVPDSDHCWDGDVPCSHFDNEGGHSKCELGFYIEHTKGYPKKPDACKNLKSQE